MLFLYEMTPESSALYIYCIQYIFNITYTIYSIIVSYISLYYIPYTRRQNANIHQGIPAKTRLLSLISIIFKLSIKYFFSFSLTLSAFVCIFHHLPFIYYRYVNSSVTEYNFMLFCKSQIF